MRHLPESLVELSKELPLTLTKTQAIEVLHVSERTFTRAVARGDLHVVKSSAGRSGRVTITRSEILRWMSERVT
jgi:hypothetical protein